MKQRIRLAKLVTKEYRRLNIKKLQNCLTLLQEKIPGLRIHNLVQ